MTAPWDNDDPLARIDGETRKANDALLDYWRMGSGRSLRNLIQSYNEPDTKSPPTLHLTTLASWSIRYDWQARIDRAKTIQDAKDAAEWEERRRQVREEDYELGGKMREVAKLILNEAHKFVRASRQVRPGKRGKNGIQLEPDREIITVALDYGAAVRAGKLGSELQRLAADMPAPTQRQQTSNLNIDLSQLTNAQLERIAAGEDPAHVMATTGES